MGWHGLLFLPCLTGQHGTKNGPQARAWAEGQARRPMRHGPQGTACLLGPIAIVPCRPVTVPCRAVPARCPGMPASALAALGQYVFRTVDFPFFSCILFDVIELLAPFVPLIVAGNPQGSGALSFEVQHSELILKNSVAFKQMWFGPMNLFVHCRCTSACSVM